MDYYVDPTGTNDGSHGTASGTDAWQTLTYALGSSGVPLTGGPHTLHVAAGTYSEGTTTGLNVLRSYEDILTVLGDTDTPSNVVVQPGSTDYQTALVLAAQNVLFSGITFQPNGTGENFSTSLMVRHNGYCENVAFEDCVFQASTATQHLYSSNYKDLDGLRWTRCTFNGNGSATMAILIGGASGIVPKNVVLDDCEVSGADISIYFPEGTQATVRDCTIYSPGSIGLLIGKDGAAQVNSATCLVERVRVMCSGTNTHGILIGTGSVGTTVRDCEIYGEDNGGYGFVLKGIGDMIERCLVMAGSANGVYFKGSKNVTVRDCTVIQQNAGRPCFASAVGLVRTENPDGKASGSVVRNCIGIAAPGSVVFNWDAAVGHDSTDDIKLSAYSGDLGTDLPSNGYGSPRDDIRPALPNRSGWSVN